ncbi:MAG: DUF72 domain-containing protein [Bacteroidota bacterium]|nr:DUF72 domain-containing protein [Bacteroidota bacterium]
MALLFIHHSMPLCKWYIGCSGFSYKEWKEEFYPAKLPQRKWFEFYCTRFNSLELNTTFYRYPSLNSLKCWYEQSPPNFIFSAKVPRFVTHFRRMTGTERMLEDFYGLMSEGLAEKAGCILFQMPPQYQFSDENLEKIISQVSPTFQNVVEFRHESWWRKVVFSALRKNKISFSGVSFPKITFDHAITNYKVCYYRFHGVPKLFYSEYEHAFVESVHQQIAQAKKIQSAFIYFNNTASLAALHNARQFQQLATQS